MKNKRSILIGGLLAALLVAVVAGIGVRSAYAQSGTTDSTTTMLLHGRGPGGRGGGLSLTGLQVAAEKLGMTTDELITALQSGKTLEQIAQEKGVDYATIQTAIQEQQQAEFRTRIQQAVTDGTMTQEKADWLLEGLDKGFIGDGPGGDFLRRRMGLVSARTRPRRPAHNAHPVCTHPAELPVTITTCKNRQDRNRPACLAICISRRNDLDSIDLNAVRCIRSRTVLRLSGGNNSNIFINAAWHYAIQFQGHASQGGFIHERGIYYEIIHFSARADGGHIHAGIPIDRIVSPVKNGIPVPSIAELKDDTIHPDARVGPLRNS